METGQGDKEGKRARKKQTSTFTPTPCAYVEPKQEVSNFVKLLGNWRVFKNPISKRLSKGIRQKIVGFDKTLSEYLTNMDKIIAFLTEQIQNDIKRIMDKAMQNGARLSVYGVSCGSSSCITCLSKYPNHYPYFRLWDENLQKKG